MRKINSIVAIFLVSVMGFANVGVAGTNSRDAVGTWLNVDDNTGEVRAKVQIEKRSDGKLYGKIIKLFDKEAQGKTCEDCTDDRKNQPILGLEMLRGAKKVKNDWDWKGGKILDPENGKEYKLRMWTSKDGKQLSVRGYLGPFYRTQYWKRAPEEKKVEKVEQTSTSTK